MHGCYRNKEDRWRQVRDIYDEDTPKRGHARWEGLRGAWEKKKFGCYTRNRFGLLFFLKNELRKVVKKLSNCEIKVKKQYDYILL